MWYHGSLKLKKITKGRKNDTLQYHLGLWNVCALCISSMVGEWAWVAEGNSGHLRRQKVLTPGHIRWRRGWRIWNRVGRKIILKKAGCVILVLLTIMGMMKTLFNSWPRKWWEVFIAFKLQKHMVIVLVSYAGTIAINLPLFLEEYFFTQDLWLEPLVVFWRNPFDVKIQFKVLQPKNQYHVAFHLPFQSLSPTSSHGNE